MPLNCRENTALDCEGEIKYLKELDQEKFTNLLFVYGILKHGHTLDMEEHGLGEFVAKAQLPGAILYRIHTGVGLRLVDDPLQVVHGEIFKITNDQVWKYLDKIENNGFTHTRKIVQVCNEVKNIPGMVGISMSNAWVYEHTYPGFKYTNLIKNGRF